MGPRAFIYCVAALAVFVLLCGSPFPGAIVGFLFGITVAFFVGPILIIIAPFLQKLGLGTSERELIYISAGFIASPLWRFS